MLYTIITILIVLICLLILLVVLVQDPKGGGLGGAFGGVSSNTLGGAKNAADFLEKTTWGLIIALFVFSLLSATVINSNTSNNNGPNKQLEQSIDDFDPDNFDIGE